MPTLDQIFKAENLPPAYPMDSEEGQGEFVPGQSRSSGNFAIDVASGIWGFPVDRVIEIFGEESTGKTTIALQKCAEENKIGRRAFYIDVEHALDWEYAKALGVKPALFHVKQPGSAEEAMKLLINSCKADDVGVVVLDTVAALATQAELDGEVGDHFMSQVARLMSTYMRQLVAICSVNETLAIMLNQNRISPAMYGAIYQPGGRALKFYASMRLSLRKVSTNKTGDVSTSNETEVTFRKNKLAKPFTTAKFKLVFGKGVSNAQAILTEAIKRKVVEKKGSWLYFEGNQVGQGLEASAKIVAKDKQLKERIINLIKEKEPAKKVKKKGPAVAGVSETAEGFID